MSAWQPGSEIDGFCLGEMIHVGSMASIYRLTGPQGPLPLIMKIPRLGPGERAVNVIGFEVCRMVLGALAQGPHHPTLVAYGDVETTPYLVMEFVEGARLSDWVGRAPVPPEEIARLGSAFALALHDLHRQDVVHLDLKPTNVLYRANGEAVLIDFGLAHHSHYPDLLAEELRFARRQLGLHVARAGAGGALRSAQRHLCARRDPLRARHRAIAVRPAAFAGRTAQAAVSRPGPAARHRPGDARVVAGDHLSLSRGRCPRALRLGRPDCLRSDESIAGRPFRARLTTSAAPAGGRCCVAGCARRASSPRPCPPPSMQPRQTPVMVVALAPREANAALLEALCGATRRATAADAGCRVACVTVVPPAAALSGEGDENSATGRHIRRLVELRRWAKPLELPEERLTYHVLESDKPAAALIDYVKMNDVDQILIGAPRRGAPARLFAGVCAQVVAEVPCSVTIVRPRTSD